MNLLLLIVSFFITSFTLAQGITITSNVSVDTSRETKFVAIDGESAKVIYDFLSSKEVKSTNGTTKRAKEVSCTKMADGTSYLCTTTVSKKGKFYNL
jgi:hypothetical protein